MLHKNTSHVAGWIRSFISGGISAVAQLSVLLFLHEWFGLWYLYASTLALIGAIGVNFSLQKIWVFKASDSAHAGHEFRLFLGVVTLNMILNAMLLSLLVGLFGAQYILAQATVILMLSVLNYLLYAKIFRT